MPLIQTGGLGSASRSKTTDDRTKAEQAAPSASIVQAGMFGAHLNHDVVGSVASGCSCSACEISHARVTNALTLAKAGHFDWYKSFLQKHADQGGANKAASYQNAISDLISPLKTMNPASGVASAAGQNQSGANKAVSGSTSRWSAIVANYSASSSSGAQLTSSAQPAIMHYANSVEALQQAMQVDLQSSTTTRSTLESMPAIGSNLTNANGQSNSSDLKMPSLMSFTQAALSQDLRKAGMNEGLANEVASSLVGATHLAATMSVADPTQGGDGARLRSSADNVEGIVRAALSRLPTETQSKIEASVGQISEALGMFHAQTKAIVADTIKHVSAETFFRNEYEEKYEKNPLAENSSERAEDRSREQREHDQLLDERLIRSRTTSS